MNVKKISLLALTLIVGLLVVGVVSAQDATPEPTQPAPGQGNLFGNRRGGFPGAPDGLLGQLQGDGLLRDLLAIITNDLGIQPADLLQQLRGQTLADVIAANGGNLDDITAKITAAITDRVNQAVTDGNLTQERADQVLANLPDLIQRALDGEFGGMLDERFGGHGGQMLPPMGQGQGRLPRVQQFMDRLDVRAPLMNAIMDATGLNGRELAQQIQSGSTLSEIISANGGDPTAVEADAIAKVTARLDEAVSNGNMTQDQEATVVAGVQAFYDAALTAIRPAVTATPAGI